MYLGVISTTVCYLLQTACQKYVDETKAAIVLSIDVYKRQTYGIPVGFTTHSLFYNKDLFAQAGVEEPTDDWTWSDLQAAAKTIEEKTGQKGFAFQMKPDPYDFEMYLWSNGTAYCDEDGQMAGQIDSKESQEVFKMFQDMEKDGYPIATEKNATDEFRAGTVAMYVYRSWSVSYTHLIHRSS